MSQLQVRGIDRRQADTPLSMHLHACGARPWFEYLIAVRNGMNQMFSFQDFRYSRCPSICLARLPSLYLWAGRISLPLRLWAKLIHSLRGWHPSSNSSSRLLLLRALLEETFSSNVQTMSKRMPDRRADVDATVELVTVRLLLACDGWDIRSAII
jgi:hypothetical protein